MRATIKAKLAGAFAAVLIIIAILGVVGVSRMSAINAQSTEITRNWMPSIDALHRMNTATSDLFSTSKELANQAEELQHSFSFLRVSTAGQDAAASRAKPTIGRPPAASSAAPSGRKPAAHNRRASTASAKPNSVHDQQSRVRGFALDLTSGGADAEDADFGQAA